METISTFEELARRHADLEHQIALEAARPHPDDILIARLKREKLQTKDRLAELARVAAATRH